MATATAIIYIGGVKLLPYHIQVEQRSDWHHRFEIAVSTEKANVNGGDSNASEVVVIDNAMEYIGEIAEITIERPRGTFHFKGYVTDVQVDQTYAGDAFIHFKGYSPTYLLEARKSVASFEEKSLKDVFEEVTQDLPANIQREVNPKYTSPIPYTVRYKETQYQFLSRLAAIYGEWFYYDGQKIVFGDLPSDSPKVNLSFGSDSMLSFNYGINARPSKFKQQFYKYQDNATLEKSMSGFKPGWLDNHSEISLKASDDLFQEEGVDPVYQLIQDKNHLNHQAEAKKSSIVGDVMIFNGQSADPSVVVGAEIEVKSQKGFIGTYRVISVSHSFNSQRNYTNIFRAIPISTIAPPTNRGVLLPEAESQVAEVMDNVDPSGLGRVRVQFKWQTGMTPWIRVQTNYAGNNGPEGTYGTYFTPEVGDEVFVDFEQGNPDRPYVTGSKYHGSIPPQYYDADNNLKAIKTRSGHELIFDDTQGAEKITINDKNGNMLRIRTSGNHITINAGNRITINAGDSIAIKAGTSISMEAGESISLMAGDLVTLTSGNNMGLLAASTVSVNAGNLYNLNTTNKMENVAANTMLQTQNLTNFVADTFSTTANNINQTAQEDINSKAKNNITISADSKLDQRGGSIDINAKDKKVRIKASGNVELKGAQIKSN